MILYGTTDLTERPQARQLLAIAVEAQWGLSSLPEIACHEFGKPFFPAFPGYHFNLSHSQPFALCALDNQPVGVDIQVVKSWRSGLAERTCSYAELNWLAGQPDQNTAFSLLWSLKEARVKQSGLGLRTPIREISIPLPECTNSPVQMDGLWFRSYHGTGWTGAVCGCSPPPSSIGWRHLYENSSLQLE